MLLTTKLSFYCLVTFLLAQNIHAFKILVFHNAYSPSQIAFSGALADILVEEGHIVDKIVMEYNPMVSNGTTKARNIYRIRVKNAENTFTKMNHVSRPFEQRPFLDPNFFAMLKLICTELVTDHQLIAKLKAEKYDLFLTSTYDLCPFGFSHLLGIPTIAGFLPTPSDDAYMSLLGIPVPPSYISRIIDAPLHDGLPFGLRARAYNLYKSFQRNFLEWNSDLSGVEQGIFEAHHPNFPSLRKIAERMTYLFMNTNELLDISKPYSAKIKFVGGVAMREDDKVDKKNMPKEIQKILDMPSKGVIILSFGSLIKTVLIPPKIMLELLEGFALFPDYTILWKFDTTFEEYHQIWKKNSKSKYFGRIEELLNSLKNIHRISWLPQKELLKEKSVKVFISHLGLNSYLELGKTGIPVLAIPLFADQFYNTLCAVHKNKIGVSLDKTKITRENVANALRELLENPIYTKNAQLLGRMINARPEKPRKVFVEHIEYAAQFPELTENIQLAAVGMNPIHYFCIDVIFYALLAFTVAVFLLFKILASVYRNFKKSHQTKPIETKKHQ